MRPTPRQAGFTLFELLVVLSVMSVVSTIGVLAYNNVTNYWRISAIRMELGAVAEDVFALIRRDVEAVAATQRTGQAIKGIDVLGEEAVFGRIPLDNDRIVLPLVQPGVNGLTERVAVMYSVTRGDAPNQLTRTLGPLDGSEPKGGKQTIADNVLALEIEYLGNDGWQPAWSERLQPEAVRISITLSGADQRSGEQIVRSAVFPIRVK